MASDLQARAKEAFVDEDYDLAMDLLTKAIAFEPNNAQYYADRAQANIKLNNLAEAVADANMAIELNPSLPKAYLRKGTACMKLKEYQTAKAALEMGASLAPGDSKFIDMLKQCHELIAEESDVTPIIPEKHTTTRDVSAKELEQKNDVSQQMTVAVAKPKYRHEFYQKPDEVVVTIFAKGIPRDSVTVDFGEQILSVRIDVPGEDAYALQPRLFGKIVPSRCRYEVLSTKMEIRLAKAEPIHWAALEFRGGATVPQRAIVSSVINVQRPTYPSSKPKRIDWDKLEAQVKKEEKDEKLDGDAALNKFFRQIYQDADEDTRRAMSKSFVESNGTVLSTNWKEVGSKKVQGSAPDGMELKKWEY
ncbi:protein SGT1 homolog B isoform X1 [Arachis duranensis]|uniref:Protein SGT1 homolog B isoform X1 n=1 Tax=Arachis duranensis TaxID=130453 RepID=A0A6P4BK66_ARADU|nr:protein SGT1 homolog B isoform X1 [Arachis duranensis]